MEADWIFGLIGGLMIGTAAALYLLVNGRIMGASGILGGLVTKGTGLAEKAAFLAGLLLVPGAIVFASGGSDTHLTNNTFLVLIAGLCVGFGTRMANGCTSGHGVCGISRLSLRGITATVSFLIAGGVTVALLRNISGAI